LLLVAGNTSFPKSCAKPKCEMVVHENETSTDIDLSCSTEGAVSVSVSCNSAP